ncbi:hypothetical protein [Erwinia mallotivora]|uniref:hypothetical protein n=1 Tax=Erwinia mallotivora TaxID=69222 RepID=UPI0021C23B75|nr:hypothetical protein [Erwinia mallotivora]
MKINLRHGLTTLVVSTASSAMLALGLINGHFVFDNVGPLDGRFYLMSGFAWQLWRADIILLLLTTWAGLSIRDLPLTNPLSAKTVLRLTIWPVVVVLGLVVLIKFIVNGSLLSVSDIWMFLMPGILLAQFVYAFFIFFTLKNDGFRSV